jgi:ParB-like chromosome segregation protein Spo0J
MGWRDKYKVHPAADVFPMLPSDEIDAIAKDIKANGLRNPITFLHVDGEQPTVVIDGRNRLEALERAGVDLQSWDISSRQGTSDLHSRYRGGK